MADSTSYSYIDAPDQGRHRSTDSSGVAFYVGAVVFLFLVIGCLYVYVQWLLAEQRAQLCERRRNVGLQPSR